MLIDFPEEDEVSKLFVEWAGVGDQAGHLLSKGEALAGTTPAWMPEKVLGGEDSARPLCRAAAEAQLEREHQ